MIIALLKHKECPDMNTEGLEMFITERFNSPKINTQDGKKKHSDAEDNKV